MTPEALRILLTFYAVSAALFSLYYLSRRRLSLEEWVVWGGITLCLPVLGPFLSISLHPGPGKRRRHLRL